MMIFQTIAIHSKTILVVLTVSIIVLWTPNAIAQETIKVVETEYFTAGTESDGDAVNIYVIVDGQKSFITDDAYNNAHIDANGEFLVWRTMINGEGQIFRHHVPTNTTIQLTRFGTNLNPAVDSFGRVTWEKWVDDTWQVYLFDGLRVKQISQGDVGVRPDIDAGVVTFGEKTDDWQGIIHDISSGMRATVGTGADYKQLTIEGLDISHLGGIHALSDFITSDNSVVTEAITSVTDTWVKEDLVNY